MYEPVDEFECATRAMTLDRARNAAPLLKPTHQGRRGYPVTDHVSDHNADATTGQLDHVVPVAAHLFAGGKVARRDVHADHVDQPLGQVAALEAP